MLQAKNSQGELVTLATLTKKEIKKIRHYETFYCPQCNEQVIVKAGQKVTPHFAHKVESDCSLYNQGEGPYHQKGKLLLFKWLKRQTNDVYLEHYIPQIKQIPDVFLIVGNKRIALEFQSSKMTSSLIIQRTLSYQKEQIIPIWILGAHHFKRYGKNQFKIDQFTLQFIHRFNPQLKTTLYFFCPRNKHFIILTHIHMKTLRRAYGKICVHPMRNLSFPAVFQTVTFQSTELFDLWRKEKRDFRLHHRRNVYGNELKWRKWLYEQGLFIDQLPSLVNLPVESAHMFRVPLWNWQSRFIVGFYNNVPVGGIFTLSQAQLFLKRFLFKQEIFPLQTYISNPLKEYLNYFIKMNYINELQQHVYKKYHHIRFYEHIEEAIQGDERLLYYLKKCA